MLPKYLLWFVLASFIEANVYSYSDSYRYQPCPYPKIEYGRARIKQRTRLVKFMCANRYELVGNRYATCRNGHWDVPMPVCVKAGCEPLPANSNSIQIREHRDAWIVTFCLPGHKLVGSSAVYCNGFKWNDTAPICVEGSVSSNLSCDFEEPTICGWTDDELHDFDWTRWNKRTPSSFLATGPSFDHTYGPERSGFYMYIESTSKPENGTARLLSPIYDSSLTVNGCFRIFYHMFGKDIGGLKVYQKPDSIQLLDVINDDEQKHLLFEQWGNQGNYWYSAAPQLLSMSEDFQIVIEGIRGASFISDIAVDDVAILQGENCTIARREAVSPPPPTPSIDLQTCAGRCNKASPNPLMCACNLQCVFYKNCCPDFIDMCYLDDDLSTTDDLPETQKLVGETTSTTPESVSTTAKSTTLTPKTTTTTARPTTIIRTTAKTTTKPTTTKPTTTKPTTTKPTTIKLTTTKPTTTKTTTVKPTTTKPTSKRANVTIQTVPTTAKPTTLKVATTVTTTVAATVAKNDSEIEREKESTEVNLNKIGANVSPKQNKSSSWRTAVILVVVLTLCVALVYVGVAMRTSRGRQTLARLRGRSTHDSEVRYLNSADDDDL